MDGEIHPDFSSSVAAALGSALQVSSPSLTRMTVALPSSECSPSAAARHGFGDRRLALAFNIADGCLDRGPTVRGRLHQGLNVAAIVLLAVAIGDQAKLNWPWLVRRLGRSRPRGRSAASLAADLRVHAARGVEHQHRLVGEGGRGKRQRREDEGKDGLLEPHRFPGVLGAVRACETLPPHVSCADIFFSMRISITKCHV